MIRQGWKESKLIGDTILISELKRRHREGKKTGDTGPPGGTAAGKRKDGRKRRRKRKIARLSPPAMGKAQTAGVYIVMGMGALQPRGPDRIQGRQGGSARTIISKSS
jgi:hypothetical protein